MIKELEKFKRQIIVNLFQDGAQMPNRITNVEFSTIAPIFSQFIFMYSFLAHIFQLVQIMSIVVVLVVLLNSLK